MGQALAEGLWLPQSFRELNQLENCYTFEGRGRVCEDLGLVRDLNVRAKCALDVAHCVRVDPQPDFTQ